MDKKSLNEMFENLLHIWNKTNFWSPKMRDYIHSSMNGVHVINLVKTAEDIEAAKTELKKLSSEGKSVLFVATKLQSRYAFSQLAEETGHFYVTEKWVPGLLTNFRTIKTRISAYLKLVKDNESWALDVLSKKDKAASLLELEKLDKAFKWLKEMKKLPDALFVIDGMYESQALREANTLGLKTFSVFNTNWDFDLANHTICANTNSMKGMEYLSTLLKDSLPRAKSQKKAFVKRVDAKKVSGETKAPRAPRTPKTEETK